MKKEKIVIEISEEEINRRIDQIEKLSCDDDLREFLINALKALVRLDQLMGMKETTLARLRKIFNKKIEKEPRTGSAKGGRPPGGRASGQGNHGQDDYPHAKEVLHELDADQKAGSLCPECESGHLYNVEPGIFINILGSPNFEAYKHITEKTRCSSCGALFEAICKEKAEGKYDSSVSSILAINHYQLSTPYYRMEKIAKQLLTPMPRSVQCMLMEKLANDLLPIWKAMIDYARECDFFYCDDTKGKVVSLMRENRQLSKKDRKGLFTTGIIAQKGDYEVNLFFTGRKHSGENISEILKNRESGLVPQIMSDALPANNPQEVKEYIKLLCLVHGRRNFIDIEKKFKEECHYVKDRIALVYKHEKEVKEKGLNPSERLEYHQLHSKPVMDELKSWCLEKVEKREIEPNSSLGHAVNYLLKHWKGLTGFLQHEGAAIDNNKMEQKLRTPVLNRKNWLFYKNEVTAMVGDIILSVLKTCESNKVNPFDYLQVIQKNREEVKKTPSRYLPWQVQF